MSDPFLFLGHGLASASRIDLWACLRDASSASVVPLKQALEAKPLSLSTRHEGGVLFATANKLLARLGRGDAARVYRLLDQQLASAHEQTPLSLVVMTNRAETDGWHQRTTGRLVDVVAALEAVATQSKGPYADEQFTYSSRDTTSVHELLYESLKHQAPVAEFIDATLRMLNRSLRAAEKKVFNDLLVERLPRWFEHRFTTDLVVRHWLCRALSVGVAGHSMSAVFREREGQVLSADLDRRGKKASGSLKFDDIEAVRRAIRKGQWGRLVMAFSESEPSHLKTLQTLSHAERVTLAKGTPDLATLICNSAIRLYTVGDHAKALALYDAGIEGDNDPMSMANPLFAVQNDNNHLGVDESRSRRYLERCLPHAKDNPVIFTNAAFVFMEMGEPQEALRVLGLAQRHGTSIKQYKNEALFGPLRGDPTFAKLMR